MEEGEIIFWSGACWKGERNSERVVAQSMLENTSDLHVNMSV